MKTVKTIYAAFCMAASLVYGTAAAQTIMEGSVPIGNLSVSRSEGKLFISMDIDISEFEVRSNREVTFTPKISSQEDSVFLPSVMVAGRNRYWHHIRNGSIQEGTELHRTSESGLIEYRATVPYSDWMGRAVLSISGLTGGCCGEPISEDGTVLRNLDLIQKTFVPKFIYVRPKPEPKVRTVSGTAYIDFPVNMTGIYEDYRGNREELGKIVKTIDAIKEDRDAMITSVSIKGHASPEGPYDNNVRLAKERTATLKEYVRALYEFPDTLVRTGYVPEDWEGLEKAVACSGLANRDRILEIIRGSLAPDAKDWKIKSTYPEDYASILKDIFPALRHSDYRVEYRICDYTDTVEIVKLLKTAPQKLSLNEMYIAACTMETGSDEYNEVFETAVRMYPDDETANLNAANSSMGNGDMKHAERYLGKAGDSLEADYARGVFAAMEKDYTTAYGLFSRLLSEGFGDAKEALEQIEELSPESAGNEKMKDNKQNL